MARAAKAAAEARPLFELATRGDVQIARLGQSVQRVEYLDLRTAPATWAQVGDGEIKPQRHRIRLTIKTDTVRAQAYARADRWDGEQWHTAAAIPGELLAAPKDMPYLRGAAGPLSVAELETKFQPARAQLLEALEAAIGF